MNVKLSVTKGPKSGTVFEFSERETFLFGRSPAARCRLPDDPCVSRNHFVLEVAPPRVLVRDLESTNGTYLNGRRFGGKSAPGEAKRDEDYLRELSDGDVLAVGDTEMRVSIAPDPPAERPAAAGEAACMEELMRLLAEIAEGGAPRELPTFPGFTVERKIGEGGMGAVYLARDREGRSRVIKVMKPRQAASEKDIRRFREREIPISMAMRHENVVRYYGGDFADGVYYLVMEYVEGSDFEKLIRAGGLRIEEACSVIADALAGLEHIHAQGVVHRDIKPPNILLARGSSGWIPKISDFGLSKDARAIAITARDEIAGSLPYMAPDQIVDFRNAGASVDVYSMGASLYEALTGRFVNDFPTGASVNDFIRIRVQELSVPIANRLPGIPDAVASAVDRAVAADPARRYGTAREFRADLCRAIGREMPR